MSVLVLSLWHFCPPFLSGWWYPGAIVSEGWGTCTAAGAIRVEEIRLQPEGLGAHSQVQPHCSGGVGRVGMGNHYLPLLEDTE